MKAKIAFILLVFAVFFSLVILADALARTCPDYAVVCGNPVVYEVTMNKLEVSTSGDETNAVTVVQTPQTFDIANVSAGAVVGSWFSGIALEPGTYNWMRRTVSTTFAAKGYVTSGGFDWYTSNNPDTANFGASTNLRRVASGTYTFTGTDVPSDYAKINFTASPPPDDSYLPAGMSFSGNSIVEEDTSQSISISRDFDTSVRITFNVQTTLQLQQMGPDYSLTISEPDVDMTIVYQ